MLLNNGAFSSFVFIVLLTGALGGALFNNASSLGLPNASTTIRPGVRGEGVQPSFTTFALTVIESGHPADSRPQEPSFATGAGLNQTSEHQNTNAGIIKCLCQGLSRAKNHAVSFTFGSFLPRQFPCTRNQHGLVFLPFSARHSRSKTRNRGTKHKQINCKPLIWSTVLGSLSINVACIAWSIRLSRTLKMLVHDTEEQEYVSLAREREAAENLQLIVEQQSLVEMENLAMKDSLKTITAEREKLISLIDRLTFERDNFKESLKRTIKRPGGFSGSVTRFHEEEDVLGSLAEREWKLKQQLDAATEEQRRLKIHLEEQKLQTDLQRSDLDSMRDELDMVRDKVKELRLERDSYLKFCQLATTHKKSIALSLANLDERLSSKERCLGHRLKKLRDAVVSLDAEVGNHIVWQHRAVMGLVKGVHKLEMNTRMFHSNQLCSNLYVDLGTDVKKLGGMAQNLLAGLENESLQLDCCTETVKQLSATLLEDL